MKKEENPADVWVSPFHERFARSMERDYPRDDWGKRIPGKSRELKIDKRPNVMVPPRKTYMDPI